METSAECLILFNFPASDFQPWVSMGKGVERSSLG